jgi:hypothetical protein
LGGMMTLAGIFVQLMVGFVSACVVQGLGCSDYVREGVNRNVELDVPEVSSGR